MNMLGNLNSTKEEIKDEIQKYDNIIIWGAGNLGTAVGKGLINMGISITAYWDKKYDSIKERNGVQVIDTFSGDIEPASTVVIYCINGYTNFKSFKEILKNKGFKAFLEGKELFQRLFCPFANTSDVNNSVCIDTLACDRGSCKKYRDSLKQENRKKEVIIEVLNFAITKKCSLKCKYCMQDNPHIPSEQKIDYPLEEAKRDLDAVSSAVDAICTLVILGGEGFLHEHFIEIVEHAVTKKNIGLVTLTTNGIWKYSEEQLRRIKNEKVIVSFSDYRPSLNGAQKKIFNDNIKMLDKLGIRYRIQQLVWEIPNRNLETNNYSVQQLKELKENCIPRRICPGMESGMIYPCSRIDVNNSTATVKLSETEGLHEKIYELFHRPYYKECVYCGKVSEGIAIPPGEQL